MKNKVILSLALTTFLIASCSKNYRCYCHGNNAEHTITNKKLKEAEETCDTYDNEVFEASQQNAGNCEILH